MTPKILPLASALLAAAGHCVAQQAGPEYGIKADDAPTGSHITRYEVSPQAVPINRSYDELSAADRARVHRWWDGIPQGDEPPFPAEGLRAIHDPIRQGNRRLKITGELFLLATIEPDGQVSEVKVLRSPSPDMARFASGVVARTPFKPAVCSGRPCRMDFPLRYEFHVERSAP